jgi:hypothetical protein
VERDIGAISDMNAARIRRIEIGAQGNIDVAANVHLLDSPKIPQPHVDQTLAHTQDRETHVRFRVGANSGPGQSAAFVTTV